MENHTHQENSMHPLVIMVIDDAKVIIERLVPALYELPTVRSVLFGLTYEEGEKILNENKVDVAILDINLKGKNGIELLRLIKNKYKDLKIMVIMMTEEPTVSKQLICKSLGADYFIEKFEISEKIADILAHHV